MEDEKMLDQYDFDRQADGRYFRLKKYALLTVMVINCALLVLGQLVTDQLTEQFTAHWDTPDIHPKTLKYLKKTTPKLLLSVLIIQMMFHVLFILGITWDRSVCLTAFYFIFILVDLATSVVVAFLLPAIPPLVLCTLIPWLLISLGATWWFILDLRRLQSRQTNPYQVY